MAILCFGQGGTWPETTLCGVSIPSEDYFAQIDLDHEGITCERCNAVIEKREKAERATERKALLMKRIQTAVTNATEDMTALRFGDFTLDECKEAVGEPDGRKIVAALRQLGYKERRSGLWYLPCT